jgi:hypothetical protein
VYCACDAVESAAIDVANSTARTERMRLLNIGEAPEQ